MELKIKKSKQWKKLTACLLVMLMMVQVISPMGDVFAAVDYMESGTYSLHSNSTNGNANVQTIYFQPTNCADIDINADLVADTGTIKFKSATTGDETTLASGEYWFHTIGTDVKGLFSLFMVDAYKASNGDTVTIEGTFTLGDTGTGVNFKKVVFEFVETESTKNWKITPYYIDSESYSLMGNSTSNAAANQIFFYPAEEPLLNTESNKQLVPDNGTVKLKSASTGTESIVPYGSYSLTLYGSNSGLAGLAQLFVVDAYKASAGDTITIEGTFTIQNDYKGINFEKVVFEYVNTGTTMMWRIWPSSYIPSGNISLHANSTNINACGGNNVWFTTEDTTFPYATLFATTGSVILNRSGVETDISKTYVLYSLDKNGIYYLEFGNGVLQSGDRITISGKFSSADGKSGVDFETVTFQYNGDGTADDTDDYWEIVKWIDYVNSGALTLHSNSSGAVDSNGHTQMWFEIANDTKPSVWTELVAVSGVGSVKVNGSDVSFTLNGGGSESAYLLVMSGVTLSATDIVTIQGKFKTADDTYGIQFEQASFEYKGLHLTTGNGYWEQVYMTGYESSGALTLHSNSSGAVDANGHTQIWFEIANGTKPSVWTELVAVSGVGSVKVNGTDVSFTLNGGGSESAYLLVFHDVTLRVNDIVTIGGKFKTADNTYGIDFEEMSFEYKGLHSTTGKGYWGVPVEIDYLKSGKATLHENSMSHLATENHNWIWFNLEQTEKASERQILYSKAGNGVVKVNDVVCETAVLWGGGSDPYTVFSLGDMKEGDIVSIEGRFATQDDSYGIEFQYIAFEYVLVEDTEKGYWKEVRRITVPYDDLTDYRTENGKIAPTKEGWLFAGWFTDLTCTTPLSEDSLGEQGTTYYAKFLDIDVMTVNAQITLGTLSNTTTTDIRFVFTVDTLDYQKAGFSVALNNGEPKEFESTTAYRTLKALDIVYEPNTICSISQFFVPLTIKNVPNAHFESVFGVQPYWVTLDGTKVMGEITDKKVKDGIDGIPYYKDDTEIALGAYMGPRRDGYRYYDGEYGTHPEDPEGGWNSFVTEKDFKDYMDAGFNYVLSEADAWYPFSLDTYQTGDFKDSRLDQYLTLADQMGLKVFPGVSALDDMVVAKQNSLSEADKAFIDKVVADLSTHKSVAGISLYDEPSIGMETAYSLIGNRVSSLNPKLDLTTCMFPLYADYENFTDSALGISQNKTNLYKEYIGMFSNAIGEFRYDHYPLLFDPSSGTYVKDDYYQNFELAATHAKENNYNAGIAVQSSGWGTRDGETTTVNNRVPRTKADIGFQVYSALAYGMKNISYYTYWEHYRQSSEKEIYDAMVMYPEENGQEAVKTDVYYAVQQVNQEIKNFDHIYMRYDWQGTIAVSKNGAEKSELLNGVSEYTSTRIQTITASEEAIVGCMKDSQGFDGFMIVNATDPGKNSSNTITVQFNDAKKALCYINGERQVVPLEKGEFKYEFAAGQGIFLIPINE